MKKKTTAIITIIVAILIVAALLKLRSMSFDYDYSQMKKEQHVETLLDKIKREGKIRVAVVNNSIDYFSYKGRMMGFQYEILQQLCKDLGVQMDLYVQDNMQSILTGLNQDVYDLVAQDITITNKRRKLVDFTVPLASSEQVLIQRRPKQWYQLPTDQLDSMMVREQLQLADKKLVVPLNSSYVTRLKSLSDEIGGTIHVIQDSITTVEELIADVSTGAIDYTVAHRDIAEVNKGYYGNIDIELPISFKQNSAWVVRKGNKELLYYLNDWLQSYMQTTAYRNLYTKYYLKRRAYISPANMYTNLQGGKLSPYDDLIKTKSEKYGMDWRLVAAIIYNESNFDASATSWVGAQGLMQIMPDAAKTFNIEDYTNPNGNIEVGLRLLTWLDEVFVEDIPNPEERIKFVLASYNVGLGHVRDAQRLAERYGKISIVWENNVDYYLRYKSKAEYVNDPEVKYGSCRGEEPYQYVTKVLDTYHHYCNLIPGES
ncbi:MAG: transporter substrate-binding domain-containing protein [Mangrovibacterium sp.]